MDKLNWLIFLKKHKIKKTDIQNLFWCTKQTYRAGKKTIYNIFKDDHLTKITNSGQKNIMDNL